MRFLFRDVPVFVHFRNGDGVRISAPPHPGALPPEILCMNECAVDVGDALWGEPDTPGAMASAPLVIDHASVHPDQDFPSASAAILHKADALYREVARRAKEFGFEEFWIVTHRNADFDAACAAYLARRLLESPGPPELPYHALEMDPDLWRPFGRRRQIDWHNPHLPGSLESDPLLSPERIPEIRWKVLLAACSSCYLHGWRTSVPVHRSLPAYFRAADKLGAALGTWREVLFDAAADAIRAGGHPLFEDVLAARPEFERLRSYLDLQREAWERDRARAWETVVRLPVLEGRRELTAYLESRRSHPLLATDSEEEARLSPVHLDDGAARHTLASAIFVDDPECILLWDYAQQEQTGGPLDEGYAVLGTATPRRAGIAGQRGYTNYRVQLLPSSGLVSHLYPLWASLAFTNSQAIARSGFAADLKRRDAKQREEAGFPISPSDPGIEHHPGTDCRVGYRRRAWPNLAYFADPWFEEEQRGRYLVGSPAHRSYPEPRETPFKDDPVRSAVRGLLIEPLFGDCEITDYEAGQERHLPFEPVAWWHPPAVAGDARFLSCTLTVADRLRLPCAEAIGAFLWKVLNGNADAVRRPDWTELHLAYTQEWVAVWNRLGIALAVCRESPAQQLVPGWKQDFDEVQSVRREAARLSTERFSREDDRERGCVRLLERIAVLQTKAGAPNMRPLRQYFEAIGVKAIVEDLREISLASITRRIQSDSGEHLEEIRKVQENVDLLELVVITFYAFELVHLVTEGIRPEWQLAVELVAMALAAVVFVLLSRIAGPWATDAQMHSRAQRLASQKRKILKVAAVFGLISLSALGLKAWVDHYGPASTPPAARVQPVETRPSRPQPSSPIQAKRATGVPPSQPNAANPAKTGRQGPLGGGGGGAPHR